MTNDSIHHQVKIAFEQIADFDQELEESPPRAAISLASARFEEWLHEEILRRFIRFQGVADFTDLSSKDGRELQKELKKAVPISLSGKVHLGHALGIFPSTTKRGIEKVLEIRNRAVHKTKPLDSQEKKNIERAISYLREMASYLLRIKSYVPELDKYSPDPPEYPK